MQMGSFESDKLHSAQILHDQNALYYDYANTHTNTTHVNQHKDYTTIIQTSIKVIDIHVKRLNTLILL